MKTLTSVSLLVLALVFFSCKKSTEEILLNDTTAGDNIEMQASPNSGTPYVSGELSYCGEQTVPLCAGQNINVGHMTVRTGMDGKVYVTYKTYGLWFFRKLHLYVGPQSGIPTNGSGNPVPGAFPYTKSFNMPYTVQQYTFVIPNMPESFVVAAHAEVVRLGGLLGNGILQQETAWGDGCNGSPINGSPSGNWGTYFNYTQVNCATLPEICSYPVNYYFDSLINGVPIAWTDVNGYGANNGQVTVAGFNYTEAEGRAIYNTPNPNGVEPISKRAFANVATLKLCQTNYVQDPLLLEAVTVTEAWLTLQGKLSPTNLPSNLLGNLLVTDAVNYMSQWIVIFQCPDRR